MQLKSDRSVHQYVCMSWLLKYFKWNLKLGIFKVVENIIVTWKCINNKVYCLKQHISCGGCNAMHEIQVGQLSFL